MFPHWSVPGVETGTYSPTWTASTPPAIGDGTIAGTYMRFGKMVYAHIKITAGSTTTFGAGEYTVSLPYTANGSTGVGAVLLTDDGVAWHAGVCRLSSTTTLKCHFGAYTNANGGAWNATFPQTFGSGDFIEISITYQAAS